MYSIQEILLDRENRSKFIAKAASTNNIITVKANIPGGNKWIKESFLIVRYFTNRVLEEFGGRVEFYVGADGICAIIPVSGQKIKERAVRLEQSDPIGRFADLDVYLKGESHSLSRGHMRKCFICGTPAFVCARRKNHSTQELLNVLKNDTRAYFSVQIADILKESLMAELNLENKFGLVTPTTSGSHKDLDYSKMVDAQGAIISHLVRLFWMGFDSDKPDGLLEKLRPVGIEAELAMYSAVGTNAYKGFIFIAGILLAATGYLLSTGDGEYNKIFEIVRTICRGITAELNTSIKNNNKNNTFGEIAYRKYSITGVRGHAESGLIAVRYAEMIIDSDLSKESLLKALCYIVGNIEDTVLLKRSGSIKKYRYFRQKINSVDAVDKAQLQSLNDECIENNISIGGSADVLASAVLLKKLRTLLYFYS